MNNIIPIINPFKFLLGIKSSNIIPITYGEIKLIADKFELSITALSKRIGIAQQTLNRQIVGENAMSLTTVEAILSCFPEISAEWLLRGDGSMFKNENAIKSNESFSEKEFVVIVDENGFLKLKK